MSNKDPRARHQLKLLKHKLACLCKQVSTLESDIDLNGIYTGSGSLQIGTTIATLPTGAILTFDGDFAGTLFSIDGDSGKITMDGLLDPSGVQMTPAASNPGDAYTYWANSSDSNNPYFGPDRLARYSELIADTSIYLSDGSITSNRVITLDGNSLTVSGAIQDVYFDSNGYLFFDDGTVNATAFVNTALNIMALGTNTESDLKLFVNNDNTENFICILNDATGANAFAGKNTFAPTAEWDINGNIRVRGLGAGPVVSDAFGNFSIGTDLDGIYGGSGSLPGDVTVTMGTNNLTWATSGAGGTKNFWIENQGSPNFRNFIVAPNGYTGPFYDFTYKASDSGGMKIEGSNGSDGNYALRIFSNNESIRIAAFENNSDIILCEDTNATRARLTIGTTTSVSDAKTTIRGVNTASGNLALYVGGSSGTTGLQVNNDDRLGFGGMGSTATKANVRASSGITTILNLANISGVSAYEFLEDGLLKFNQSPVSGAWGTAYNVSSTSTSTGTSEQSSGFAIRHNQSPEADGTSRANALYAQALKNTAFNSNETTAVGGYAQNTSTGNVTSLRGGYFEGRNDGVATITNLFGAELSNVNVGNGTITHYGGLKIGFSTRSTGTITNQYGIYVTTPINQSGGTITNTYGLRIEDNSEGSNNWGLYILGSGKNNYLQGSLGLNTDTPDASALLEMVSTTQGFCPPRMNETQRDAISNPLKGLIIYNTDTDQWEGNNGTPGTPNWTILG